MRSSRLVPTSLLPILAALAILHGTGAPTPAQTRPRPPAASPSTPPPSRYVPLDQTALYFELPGLEAQAAAWDQTAAAKILKETTLGALLEDLAGQSLERSLAASAAGAAQDRAEALAMLKHMFNVGCAFGCGFKPEPGQPIKPADVRLVLVVRDAMRADAKATFGKLLRSLNEGSQLQKLTKPGSRTVIALTKPSGQSFAWWIEKGKDLVLVHPAANADAVVAALDGKAPNAETHPGRAESPKADASFKPLAFFSFDPGRMPRPPTAPAPSSIQASLKRIDLAFGVEDEAIVTRLRLAVPSPRTGAFALLDQPALNLKTLPATSPDVADLTAASLDPARLFEQLGALVQTISPTTAERLTKLEEYSREKLRLRLKQDILGKFGPRLLVTVAPPKKKKSAAKTATTPPTGLDALAALTAGVQVPRVTALIELKDPKGAAKALDSLVLAANQAFRDQAEAAAKEKDKEKEKDKDNDSDSDSPRRSSGGSTRRGRAKLQVFEFKMATPQPRTYILSMPTNYSALTNLRLTLALGKKHLIIASAPDVAHAAIVLEAKAGRWKPSAEQAEALEHLPAKPMFFSISDSRETVAAHLAQLPATIQALTTPLPPTAPAATTPGPGGPGGGPIGPGGPQGLTPGGGRQLQGLIPGGGGNPGGGPPPPGAPNAPGAPGAGASPDAAPPIQLDPSKVPEADAIKKYLFLESVALSVDDQGAQVVWRTAFPDLGGILQGVQALRSLRPKLPTPISGPLAVVGPKAGGGPSDDAMGGYTVDPPRGFEPFEVPALAELRKLAKVQFWKGKARPDGTSSLFTLTIEGIPGQAQAADTPIDRRLEDATAGFMSGLGKTVHDVKQVSSERLELDGKPGVRLIYTGTEPKTGRKIRGVIFLMIDGPSLVAVGGMDAEDHFEENQKLLEAAARTIHKK